ncbi:NAD/NADP octopine/nopaline dehydrogenase family protein [Vibrio sp. nBUS_14]|uniref:NAD/NADP octopine/nopaline dehydrogenase family protein n=1 Tax=Vibrio sp. nBUS_14 TaxID=3395321 RepID=UPI003EBDA6AE
MKKNVLIIGGGHVGVSLAVDLDISRNDVTVATLSDYKTSSLIEFFHSKIDVIDNLNALSNSLCCKNIKTTEFNTLDSLTQYDAVFICVPDIYELRNAILLRVNKECKAQCLVVHIRAGQAGLINTLQCIYAGSREVAHILVEDSLYGTRVDFQARRITTKRKKEVNVSVVNGDARTLEALGGYFAVPDLPWFPCLNRTETKNLLFDPLGFIIHSGVCLDGDNLDKTLSGQSYNHYIEGVDRALGDKLENLDNLRVSLASSYGAKTTSFKDILNRQYNIDVEESLYLTLQNCTGVYKSMSPKNIEALKSSRYIHEDIPALYVFKYLMDREGITSDELDSYISSIEEKCQRIGIDLLPLKRYKNGLYDMKYTKFDIMGILNER